MINFPRLITLVCAYLGAGRFSTGSKIPSSILIPIFAFRGLVHFRVTQSNTHTPFKTQGGSVMEAWVLADMGAGESAVGDPL